MNDVEMTSLSLVAYAYALPFLLSSKFFNSVFFAANKTKFVLFSRSSLVILNLALNYLFIFVYDMGHVGASFGYYFCCYISMGNCNNLSI